MGVILAPTANQALDRRSSRAGLRAVASFEALKGVLVILLGVLLLIFHSRADTVTQNLLDHLHIDLDARIGHAVMNAADKLTGAHVWTIATAAMMYAVVRFVEAWGLWHQRVWAEWFALLSGAMYLPFEVLKVAQRMRWERVAVLVVNLVIVLYMLSIRIRQRREQSLP